MMSPLDQHWVADADTEYGFELLEQLNEEYTDQPVVPQPPQRTDAGYAEEAKLCKRFLPPWITLEDRNVLEIGCGSGHFGPVAGAEARAYVGVDIDHHSNWQKVACSYPNCRFEVVDLSLVCPFENESFDLIVSWVVWEHLERPYEMLNTAQRLLRPGGYMILFANVYTSAIASHLYRDIFFPWPHLLFPEAVLREYVRERWRRHGHTSADTRSEEKMPDACLYVNRVTLAQYVEHFRRTGWQIEKLEKIIRPLDRNFIDRFRYVLGRYPEEDLELDFFAAVLRAPGGLINRKKVSFQARQRLRRTFRRLRQVAHLGAY